MKNDLKVIQPFLQFVPGDVLKYDEKINAYAYSSTEEVHKTGNGSFLWNNTCTISMNYISYLIKEGYLKEEDCDKIVDNCEARVKYYQNKYNALIAEIKKQHDKYSEALKNPNNEDQPKCLQVEQETVLKNLEKITKHFLDFAVIH